MSDKLTSKKSPPKWADRFLEWYCSAEMIDEIQGDLYESFYANMRRLGHKKAKWLFIFYVIRFFRPSSFSKLTIEFYPAMYRNYLTTALRNFWREKGYTFINISGLSVGLACSILIMLWVQDELAVNQFHTQVDQLYQVNRHVSFENGKTYTWSAIPKPLAQVLEKEIPEVRDAELITWQNEFLIKYGDQTYREKGNFIDTAFFDMFSFPLTLGEKTEVLKDPSSIVISESLAEKYFGAEWKENSLGKTLKVNNEWDFTVSGVFEDMPENSTMKFSFGLPIGHFIKRNTWLEHWGNSSLRMYVRLNEERRP